MRIFITIAGLAPEFGGPSRSVPRLAEALARQDLSVKIVTCEAASGSAAPLLPNPALVATDLVPARSRLTRWWPARNDFFRILCANDQWESLVIHDNGLWLPTNHAVAVAARTHHWPRLISPRGMLSNWAMRRGRWRKRIAWLLYQRRDLFGATALHATSGHEAEEFRTAGFRGPIGIVPNGIDIPDFKGPAKHKDAIRTALFLSRIHPKKGLHDLVEAWAAVRPDKWRMVITGDGDPSYRRQIEDAIRRHGLSSVFSFAGPATDEAKWTIYRDADLFILPSQSENFGIVVAEALASGVPVITTRGTPWRELADRRCGWCVDIGSEPLARALREAVALSDEERREMGQRGRVWMEQEFSWAGVATRMRAVYEWLLGRGSKPECVIEA